MVDPVSTTDGPAQSGYEPGRSRVLLVEDDDLDVIAFHRVIASLGISIELQRARNAAEAFEMLRLQVEEQRSESMLIVLDLNMPSMNGIEFLAELRQDPELSSSVVFAFTTSDDPEDMRRCFEHHVAAYVTKQVDEDSTKKLAELIEIYLRSVRMPRIEAVPAS